MLKVIFFENFLQTMLEFQDEAIMIFGDMNGALDPKKDRSRNPKHGKLPKNVFQYLEMQK